MTWSSLEKTAVQGSFLDFSKHLEAAEFSDVVGHEPVQVTAGDDVILPCHLEPPLDVTNLLVVWTLNDRTVHLYRQRTDDHDDQDEQFRNRTSLFHHEMTRGNISLKMTNVHEDDSGLYFCYVPKLDSQVKEGNVSLSVNSQKIPGGSGGDKTQDDNTPTKDDQTGVFLGSILGPLLLIIAALALMFLFIKRGRNNQGNNPQGEQQDAEEGNHVTINPQNGGPGADPGHVGQTMSLVWPGNTSGSPGKS